jgi:hypothetical protein
MKTTLMPPTGWGSANNTANAVFTGHGLSYLPMWAAVKAD